MPSYSIEKRNGAGDDGSRSFMVLDGERYKVMHNGGKSLVACASLQQEQKHRSSQVNRQVRVRNSKYVAVSDPLHMGHVMQ